jgi:transcriptional regulator with XRE-family HTH domain
MTKKAKPKYKNRLAQFRKRNLISQKQVGILLGHKGYDQVSRYERGVKLPSLKDALKLGLLYKLPIKVLLDDYFDMCWREFSEQEKRLKKSGRQESVVGKTSADDADFCTIEERLEPNHPVSNDDLNRAYSHSAKLIRRRAEKLDHI